MNWRFKIMKNFVGLLKRKGDYHFLNSSDLVHFFIKETYKKSCVLVLYDSKTAFLTIPKLTILKRDNYDAFLLGLANDFVVIKFNNQNSAIDFAYELPIDVNIKWEIYDKGRIIKKNGK